MSSGNTSIEKQKIDEIVELIQYLIEDDSNIERSLSNKNTGTKLLKLDEIKESINSVQSSKVKNYFKNCPHQPQKVQNY